MCSSSNAQNYLPLEKYDIEHSGMEPPEAGSHTPVVSHITLGLPDIT